MKAIPADLAEQVRSVGIDLSATGRLAAIYHRSLARRAVNKLDEAQRPQVEDLVRHTRRLAPATVYSLYKDTLDPDLAEITRRLEAACKAAPTVVYNGPHDTLWLCDGLQEVLRSLNWGEEKVGTIVTDIPDRVRTSLELAREALRCAWPEAWAEHNTLVHYLVFAQGPLRSATIQSTFGVVYAEVKEASDPLRVYELLLHESAHHSLALREQFTEFLNNPDTVGTHALRPDPRPLRGVLHAAFVMCRMAEGIGRYRRSYASAADSGEPARVQNTGSWLPGRRSSSQRRGGWRSGRSAACIAVAIAGVSAGQIPSDAISAEAGRWPIRPTYSPRSTADGLMNRSL